MPRNTNNTSPVLRRFCAAALLLALSACASRNPAPVSDARPDVRADARPPAGTTATTPGLPNVNATAPISQAGLLPKPVDPSKIHVIKSGDTMFSIAKLYGVDYRELAAWNNIVNPTAIRLGDTLRLTRPDGAASPTNATSATPDGANQPTPTTNSTTPLTAGEVITTPLVVTPPIAIEKPLINSATVKIEPKASKLTYSDQAYAKMLAESGVASASAVAPNAPPAILIPSTAVLPSIPATAGAPPTVTLPQITVADSPSWSWPVKGKVTATFTETTKGIDIAGTRGKAVLAAASGKVIYSEAGLRGYGRMIIIKHSEQWLSAYAHNEKILVHKDQEIKQGQKIAEMGSSDTDSVKLHFEIRKLGKPVDPMKYLPAQ